MSEEWNAEGCLCKNECSECKNSASASRSMPQAGGSPWKDMHARAADLQRAIPPLSGTHRIGMRQLLTTQKSRSPSAAGRSIIKSR